MSTAIRLSPSGPVITNPAGAPLAPGTGARLRLAEASTTIGTTNVIPTAANLAAAPYIGPGGLGVAGGPALIASLPNPSQSANYRMTALLDVRNPSTNVNGVVQLYLATSWDNGVTWHEQASNQHQVAGEPTAGNERQMRIDQTLISGAALGMTPGAPSLQVRAHIGATVGGNVLQLPSGDTGDGASRGAFLLQLEEMF
jgi:hypothetical protein